MRCDGTKSKSNSFDAVQLCQQSKKSAGVGPTDSGTMGVRPVLSG